MTDNNLKTKYINVLQFIQDAQFHQYIMIIKFKKRPIVYLTTIPSIELLISMQQHSSRTCISSPYLPVDMIFRSFNFIYVFLPVVPGSGEIKLSILKFYERHHDLVDRYRISVSQMTTDMFQFLLCRMRPTYLDLSPGCFYNLTRIC